MAFMTPAEIKAVRLKDSKVVTVLGKQVRVIQMASAAQMKSAELNQEILAGRKKTSDSFLFFLEHGLSNLEGDRFTAEDAAIIYELLPQPELISLVEEITALVGKVPMKKLETPPAELTPAEKKG